MLFEGLLSYQIWLLVAGAILFVALLVILIILTLQKRSAKWLLPFFIISIVMMGFPGIKRIEWPGGGGIETKADSLANNPADPTARRELKMTLDDYEKRHITDPNTKTKMARAYEVLGDTARAISAARSALTKNPRQIEANRILRNLTIRPPGH